MFNALTKQTQIRLIALIPMLFGVALLTHNLNTKGIDFLLKTTPEIKVSGEVVTKTAVSGNYWVSVRILGELESHDVDVEQYYNTKVGDTVSFVVRKESTMLTFEAFFLLAILAVLIGFSNAVTSALSAMILLAISYFLLNNVIPPWTYMLCMTYTTSSDTLGQMQRERLLTAVNDRLTKKFLFINSQPTADLKWKFFGFVHTVAGRVYNTKEEAVIGKLKGK